MLWFLILAAALVVAGAAAWRAGGARERQGFWLIAGAVFAALSLGIFLPSWPFLRLIPELILLGGLVALAWKHDRPWPAWSASCATVLAAIEAYGAISGSAGSERAALLAASGVAAALAVGALRRPWTIV